MGPMSEERISMMSSAEISAPSALFSSMAQVMPLMIVPIQEGSVL